VQKLRDYQPSVPNPIEPRKPEFDPGFFCAGEDPEKLLLSLQAELGEKIVAD